MNTAQLREMAYNAASFKNWSEAARLYDLAANAYPQPANGALAIADIEGLRAYAANARAMLRFELRYAA